MEGEPVLNDYPFGRQVKCVVLVLVCFGSVLLANFLYPFLPLYKWTPWGYSGKARWPEAGRPPVVYYDDFKVLFETEFNFDKLPRLRRLPLVGHDKSRDCVEDTEGRRRGAVSA